MQQLNNALYDEMADSYHLIFANWQESIDRQGAILAGLLSSPMNPSSGSHPVARP